jgi:hypothetical protein
MSEMQPIESRVLKVIRTVGDGPNDGANKIDGEVATKLMGGVKTK